VEPILTLLSFCAFDKYAVEMGFGPGSAVHIRESGGDNDGDGHGHGHDDTTATTPPTTTEQEQEQQQKMLVMNGGGHHIDSLSDVRPDCFIALDIGDLRIKCSPRDCVPMSSIKHLALLGSAKWRDELDVVRHQVISKPLTSPLFGYTALYIIVSGSGGGGGGGSGGGGGIEIGLFSPLNTANNNNSTNNTNNKPTVIFSHTFPFTDLVDNCDQVGAMVEYLQFLVGIQCGIYRCLSASGIKMVSYVSTRFCETAKRQIVTVLAHLVDGFVLDASTLLVVVDAAADNNNDDGGVVVVMVVMVLLCSTLALRVL
jgi:hypothetical protein